MHVKLTEKCPDHDGPVLDITFCGKEEAFELGRLFENIMSKGMCSWHGEGFIRIPLVPRDDLGLAVTYGGKT